jgi:alpha-galactosidase
MRNNLLLFFFFCSIGAFAQNNSSIQINSARFKTGDDMAWQLPSFDDKDWPTIKTNMNWEDQGFSNYDGYAWYRIHLTLPAELKEKAWWKDSLRIYLAKIDDADEIFFNGKRIAKTGSFPSDPGGYETRWNTVRDIHLSSNDPVIHWNGENIIAIKVYDGGGPGGLYGGIPFVGMMNLADGIKMNSSTGKINQLVITNMIPHNVSGTLKITVQNVAANATIQDSSLPLNLKPHTGFSTPIKMVPGQRLELHATFTEKETGQSVSVTEVPPYILTPAPSPLPRINNATVFGIRPGSPFLFKIAATGEKPLQYSVEKMPAGLSVDAKTGIISGQLDKEGDYSMTLLVKNKLGMAKKTFTIKCGNLLALTPPMGWNSWNCWGLSVSDEKLKSSAKALIDKGLIDHGWTYMNIDDGWEAPKRKENGEIIPNKKFPDMQALGNWLHGQGLKFGIYSSPGAQTCGGYLGTYQHEQLDADVYSRWGIDYLKYDWCSYEEVHDKKDSSTASYKKPYEVMRDALRKESRDIVYSLCQYGMKDVWKWGADVNGNCWRTTGDINDSWESLSEIGFHQYQMAPYARPGRWNDPDMLIVGQLGWGEHLHATRLNPDEQYTHISLWCLLSAPLLIGCDISKMDDFTLNLLTNDEVIALDQDPLGKAAMQLIRKDNYQVWVKELSDGGRAVGIFNASDMHQNVSIPLADLQLRGSYKMRDLWRQKDLGASTTVNASVPPHGVLLLKLVN